MRTVAFRLALGALCLSALSACGGAAIVGTSPPPAPVASAPKPASQEIDHLGPRPVLGASRDVRVPPPVVFKTANAVTVWLVERHALPLVSVTIALPAGAASDPPDRPGLAHLTADMLDEGAGDLDAIALSAAINDLGTSLSIETGMDASTVSMTVLKGNFPRAIRILSDVVARPRMEARDFKRVSDLWINGLEQRQDDPDEVARVVIGAALYGARTPYGHPRDGYAADARKVKLADVKTFHASQWRPDRAVAVVVGDVTRAEVESALAATLESWKASAKPAPSAPDLSSLVPAARRPRLIVVDRADAPQSVIAVVRDGVSAGSPEAPLLDLVNTALGGSFTSRLNQNLREDKHWTYGAFTAFTHPRGQGAFVARSSVFVEVTGKALKEMLGELENMAARGMTEEELSKVKAQDRADLIQTYETVGDTSQRLAQLFSLGLDPSFDVKASVVRQAASLELLAEQAKAHVDASKATVVVVGPKDKVVPQLAEVGLDDPVFWGPEGPPATPGAVR